jgi:hypothetical protein
MLQPDSVPRQHGSISSRVAEFTLGNQWIREPALEHSGWPVRVQQANDFRTNPQQGFRYW